MVNERLTGRAVLARKLEPNPIRLTRHCEPTGPARSGRPDDRLREAIQEWRGAELLRRFAPRNDAADSIRSKTALGSAFLSADLELTPEVREDHAAYIGTWIKLLRDDKRAIFTAASHAQRAADFLHVLQQSVGASNFGFFEIGPANL
jgi:hypothetical protein